MLTVILIIVIVVILFFMFGGVINWKTLYDYTKPREEEKDYVLTDTPTSETYTEEEIGKYMDIVEEDWKKDVVRTTLESINEMTKHGEEVDTAFVQPYSTTSVLASALRWEALAKSKTYQSEGYH